MTKKLLSDFHHDDPFIHDISRGTGAEELEEEDCEFFIPDTEQDGMSRGWSAAASTVRFTPSKQHQHSYVPTLGREPPLFYARSAEDNIPCFEPDFEPLLDYNGIQYYVPYQSPQFPPQTMLRQDDGGKDEVVVELRTEPMVIQDPHNPPYSTGHPSSGNFDVDSLLYKNLNQSLNGQFGQSQGGDPMECLSSKLKYDL